MKTKTIAIRGQQHGFTLVELLIVVIILAILAAIVVPQFTSSTEDARLAAAETSLVNIRSAISLYYQQHGEYPGDLTAVPTSACTGTAGTGAGGTGAPAAASFLQQLSTYTDGQGGSCTIADAANHRFGPYLGSSTMQPEPFTESAAIEAINTGDLNMGATAGDPGGYKYDTKTGKIIINLAAYAAL